MTYKVKLNRAEMIDVLDALQAYADYLEQSAALQDKEERHLKLLQLSRRQLELYRKILDTCERID